MRTRTRTIVKNIVSAEDTSTDAVTYYCTGGDPVVTHGTFPGGSDRESEYIQEFMMDDAGPQKGPKSCYHRSRHLKANALMRDYAATLTPSTWARWSTTPASHIAGLTIGTLEELGSWDVSQPTTSPYRYNIARDNPNESSLIEDCFEKARQLKADGLLNIVEANQAWPSIKSLALCLPSMGKHWNQVRKLVRTASGAYLAWKFGVSPILSDVMATLRYLPKLADDIKRFGDQGKRRFTASCNSVATFDDTPTGDESGGILKTVWNVTDTVPTIRYVLVVEPNRTYHTDAFKALDVVFSRFASTPASIAWELVPFSFVVDWFVDLRGALRTIDRLVGFEPFKIVSFTRSFVYDVTTFANFARVDPCVGSVIFSQDAGFVRFRHYERTLASTSATLPSWKPRFGKSQAGISAALIGQQLSKLH